MLPLYCRVDDAAAADITAMPHFCRHDTPLRCHDAADDVQRHLRRRGRRYALLLLFSLPPLRC